MCARAPLAMSEDPVNTQGPGIPPLLIFLMRREMCARAQLAMSEDLVVLRALASPSSNISADVQGDVCPGPAGHV